MWTMFGLVAAARDDEGGGPARRLRAAELAGGGHGPPCEIPTVEVERGMTGLSLGLMAVITARGGDNKPPFRVKPEKLPVAGEGFPVTGSGGMYAHLTPSDLLMESFYKVGKMKRVAGTLDLVWNKMQKDEIFPLVKLGGWFTAT